jgi:hypothetical protein
MVALNVNGKNYQADVDLRTPLLWVLRDTLGLTGTKYGCGIAQCGACTVHIGGVATRSCQVPVSQVAGKPVTTIEGLEQNGVLNKVQQAWLDYDVPQCSDSAPPPRDFVPWRFSDAGLRACGGPCQLPASENLHKSGHPRIAPDGRSRWGAPIWPLVCRGLHHRLLPSVRSRTWADGAQFTEIIEDPFFAKLGSGFAVAHSAKCSRIVTP